MYAGIPSHTQGPPMINRGFKVSGPNIVESQMPVRHVLDVFGRCYVACCMCLTLCRRKLMCFWVCCYWLDWSSSTTFQQLQQKAVHPISINDELVRQIATGSWNNNKSMNSFSQDAHSALQPYWPYLAVKLHHFGLSCEVTRWNFNIFVRFSAPFHPSAFKLM